MVLGSERTYEVLIIYLVLCSCTAVCLLTGCCVGKKLFVYTGDGTVLYSAPGSSPRTLSYCTGVNCMFLSLCSILTEFIR